MKKRMIFVIIILNLLSAFSLFPSILTLDQAREIALENNPSLLAEKHSRQAAVWDMWDSALSMIPSASLTGSYTEYRPDFMNADEYRSYGVSVSQPIFNGGSLLLNYLMKRDQLKISEASLKKMSLSTLAEVDSKYFSVLESENLLAIARKDLDSSVLHLDIARARYEAGTLSRADLLQMQSQKANKEVSLLQIENLYKISQADLANYLQIPSDFSLEEISFTDHETYLNAVQNLHQEQIDKFTDYITALGLDRNPSLRISHISRNISKKILLMAGGRFLPSLNLSYSRNWEKYDYQSDYEDSERLMLTAAIPIFPLLDNYSALSKARHDHKRSQYDLDAAEDGIKLALKSAVLNLITSAKSVYAARIALDYARETYEQMEERFRSNLLSTSELLDIELLLTSAENQYIISLFDFLRAKSTLQQQTGIEDEQLIFNTKIFDKGEK